MKLPMRCPHCGHHVMHYREAALLRDETRADVFSCRGCGSAYEADEIQEIVDDYMAALASVAALPPSGESEPNEREG